MSGDSKLERLNQAVLNNRVKAILLYSGCFFAMICAVVLKFVFVGKLSITKNWLQYLCIVVILLCMGFVQIIFLLSSRKELISKPKSFAAFSVALLLSFLVALFLEILGPYVMPVSLAAFIIAPLCQRRDAFIANIFTNVTLVFVLITQSLVIGGSSVFPYLIMFIAGIFSGSVAAYWVSNDTKRFNYIIKSLLIATLTIGMTFMGAVLFGVEPLRFLQFLPYLCIGLYGQVILAQVLQPIFESIFNLLTNMRLVEFADHNSPLIKRLIVEAPGTFNHCLAVANFAEMCASAIGENPYLARTCAYYHDIGKLINPEFFKENQADYNPHDELLPEVSADYIRAHTTEGNKLCKIYRIPQEIADVTVQHHGTMPIYIFLIKARKLTDGEVDADDYSYHGQTPVSKIAAIIMLCDTGEAAIRSMEDTHPDKVDKLLTSIINDRISSGQFDDCDISLNELNIIKNTIKKAYGGQFHKRIAYPNGDKKK